MPETCRWINHKRFRDHTCQKLVAGPSHNHTVLHYFFPDPLMWKMHSIHVSCVILVLCVLLSAVRCVALRATVKKLQGISISPLAAQTLATHLNLPSHQVRSHVSCFQYYDSLTTIICSYITTNRTTQIFTWNWKGTCKYMYIATAIHVHANNT